MEELLYTCFVQESYSRQDSQPHHHRLLSHPTKKNQPSPQKQLRHLLHKSIQIPLSYVTQQHDSIMLPHFLQDPFPSSFTLENKGNNFPNSQQNNLDMQKSFQVWHDIQCHPPLLWRYYRNYLTPPVWLQELSSKAIDISRMLPNPGHLQTPEVLFPIYISLP